MILARHPNLVVHLGQSILPNGQIEDLSGSGNHANVTGTAPTLSADGGLTMGADTSIWCLWLNGTVWSKPHKWRGLTLMIDAAQGTGQHFCGYAMGPHWDKTPPARPKWLVYSFRYGGQQYLASNFNDWAGHEYNRNRVTAEVAGRQWHTMRFDLAAATQVSRFMQGRSETVTSGEVVSTEYQGDYDTSLVIPYGYYYQSALEGVSYNDGMILYGAYLFDACLDDSDVERVKMGLSPIRLYDSPKTFGS